ncbi:MAG: hypothetical protein ABF315_04740, partial [Lentimonas sp.]
SGKWEVGSGKWEVGSCGITGCWIDQYTQGGMCFTRSPQLIGVSLGCEYIYSHGTLLPFGGAASQMNASAE